MKLLKVVIPTREFEAAIAFYRDVLGLPLVGAGWCEMSAGNANIAIQLAREGSDFAPTGHGIYLDLSESRLEQIKQRPQDAGVAIAKEWKDERGHFLEIADPDGNLIELVE